jgi:ABC-type multidrug transport system ATPase subunit
MVGLSDVRKRFSARGRWVLDGIDLTADSGTVTVIAGGNGSGKSTLLRIAAGASAATAGRVRRRADAVGYVPERLPSTLRMTATEYVGHMGRLRGLDPPQISRRARALFDRLELRPGPDAPIASLSKGNSQKVALTQALLAEPDLLVLDEPFSGLDESAGAALEGLLQEARSAGAATLVSAHEPGTVRGADIRLVLDGGRLRADQGTPVVSMELVLRAVDERADVRDLPGIAEHSWSGRRLTVRTPDADAVLRVALASGWSLLEARRSGETR